MANQMNYIKTFSEITDQDLSTVGGKGLSLAVLSRAGIPVPSGFVITTEAYTAFSGQLIPDSLQQSLIAAFDSLQTERVAVRSSATAEDSTTASWAGQLETYLNITRETLFEAITK